MRKLKLFVVIELSLLLVSCGNESALPTGPAAAPMQPAYITCPTPPMIRGQINALFPRGVKQAAGQAFYVVMQIALAKHNVPAAQQVMFVFLKYTLYEYQRGGLTGGQSTATQTNLTTLTASLYCAVGLPAPVIDPGSLGSDGAIAIVDPGSPTTVITTGTQFAGVLIPAGAVPVTTVITISRLPDAPGPLLTPLDQYPAFYHYSASPNVTFNLDVTVGVCQVATLPTPVAGRLRIGHNVGSGVEILPLASAGFLQNGGQTCNPFLGALNTPGGLYRYVLNGAGRLASYVLLPEVAQASGLSTCCLGGTTKKFSPFGAIDPVAIVSAVSPTSFTAPAGGSVPGSQLPSVRLVTPAGQPVPGFTVTFSVPIGAQGAITGATQVTDANGVATLGGWTLGAPFYPDSVIATVIPYLGSVVSGNPLLFVAQASPTVIPYASTGYRYSLLGTGTAPTGWEQPGFDFTAWPTGAAAFGSPGGCTVASGVVTDWPVAPNPSTYSDLLVRRSFPVPAGWTGDADLTLLIDNDARIFVNGQEITNGFVIHEGCADVPPVPSYFIPGSLLNPGGANEVEVYGRDRGGESYLDMQVTLNPGG